MKQIELAYGQESISLEFDPQHFHVLSPEIPQTEPLTDLQIGDAFDHPIDSASIEDIFSPGESVLLVVSDATRATASAQVVNLFVRRLIQNGIVPGDISIIFATGIHRPVTEAEKEQLLTRFIFQRVKTLDHDASDPTQVISLGTTARSTPVELNRALREFTHVVLTGGIGFHYFAGFTGGRKSICPGLASAQTIAATHLLAMDFEHGGRRHGIGPGLLDGNAIHEECDAIAELVRPLFAINCVVDEMGRAVKVYAGHWRTAHRKGCLKYRTEHSVEIDERRDLVIVSAGGSPYDINMIQAHKALDMAAYACREGGTIILLAECAEGLGRADFLKWFSEKNSSALERRLREAYEVNGQTAWALMEKAERFRVMMVSSLPEEVVKQMRMVPVGSLSEALLLCQDISRSWSSRGYILPRGASFLPVG